MSEQLYFLDMFSGYEPDDTLRQAIAPLQIVGAELDQAHRYIELTAFSQSYIPWRYIDQVKQDLCQLYLLNGLDILV